MSTPSQTLLSARREKRREKTVAWQNRREEKRFKFVFNGCLVRIQSGESYWCEHRGRYAQEVSVICGKSEYFVSRDWMLENTTSWRDYSPDTLRYGAPLCHEAWSPAWMFRAVEEGVWPNLSVHQRLAWMAAARGEGGHV